MLFSFQIDLMARLIESVWMIAKVAGSQGLMHQCLGTWVRTRLNCGHPQLNRVTRCAGVTLNADVHVCCGG